VGGIVIGVVTHPLIVLGTVLSPQRHDRRTARRVVPPARRRLIEEVRLGLLISRRGP